MTDNHYRFYIRQGEFELDVEGDQGFVETYVAAFLAGEAGAERERPVAGNRTKAAAKSKKKAIAARKQSGLIDAEALKKFVTGKKLSSDSKRYLAFMKFMKNEGFPEVSAAMIKERYEILGLPFKSTSRQNLFLMKKSGKAAAGTGEGLYSLTEKGEAAAAKLTPAKKKSKTKAKSSSGKQVKKRYVK